MSGDVARPVWERSSEATGARVLIALVEPGGLEGRGSSLVRCKSAYLLRTLLGFALTLAETCVVEGHADPIRRDDVGVPL